MTTEELERLAANDAEMPDDLDMPEQLLFLTLRELYSNFRSGAVNRERGKREKSRIMVAYGELKGEYSIVEEHLKVRERLKGNIGELYECGCPNCRHLLNIFVGIDRKDIPTDIKEVNALNERLREMVKERSERNAELATTIDRVRWVLDSDKATEEKLERIKEIVKK